MAGETKTGGRAASTGVIRGRHSLSVGKPNETPPVGWKWVALTDVARLETGHTPSRQHPEYWGGDVPWIGIRDATGNHGRVILDTEQHTNDRGIANSSARILPANTVCLSRTASVGYVVVMGRPMATSQDFVNWVCSSALNHQFLKYVLLAEHDTFLRFASGTTHQTIYFPEVKAFHVCMPTFPEQQAITRILGALDDKIELNQQRNRTLDAMARTIFQNWFVDFGPVKAKAAGRKPAKLSKEIAALFPASFEDSALGKIPKGWRACRWGDIATLEYGKSLRDYAEAEGPYRVFGTNGPIGWHSEPLCNTPGIVIGRKGAYRGVHFSPRPFFVIDTAFYLNLNDEIDVKWAYYELLRFDINNMDSGSAIPSTSRTDFYAIPVCLPAPTVLQAFGKLLQPIYDQRDVIESENSTLAALRDALLPKLISGELRVPDAEQIVGRAT